MSDGERVFAHEGNLGTWWLDILRQRGLVKGLGPCAHDVGLRHSLFACVAGGQLYVTNDSEDRSYRTVIKSCCSGAMQTKDIRAVAD